MTVCICIGGCMHYHPVMCVRVCVCLCVHTNVFENDRMSKIKSAEKQHMLGKKEEGRSEHFCILTWFRMCVCVLLCTYSCMHIQCMQVYGWTCCCCVCCVHMWLCRFDMSELKKKTTRNNIEKNWTTNFWTKRKQPKKYNQHNLAQTHTHTYDFSICTHAWLNDQLWKCAES